MTSDTSDPTPEGLHVVLGAGAIGLTVVGELVRRGGRVRVVNRSGDVAAPDGVEVVAADLSDRAETERAIDGASVAYHTVNPPYHRWVELFPPIHTAIIGGATRTGARLVMADNLYMYGRPDGGVMSERSPVAPASAKGELRARMAAELLEAHHRGDMEVAIGRASDYFGPGGLTSQMGERVFGRLAAGEKAQVMGDPDTRHTYTYLPDIGRALVTLGAAQAATGEVWHLPSQPALTTRHFIDAIADHLGQHPGISVMPPAMLAVLSWFNPMLRAVREETYQLQSDWIMDDSRYRETFGHGETPLDEALAATIAWFRSRANAGQPSTGVENKGR